MSAEEFRYWQSVPENQIADQHAASPIPCSRYMRPGSSISTPMIMWSLMASDFCRLPGHTPHHVSLLIESGGQSAVITGDVVHHPCQLAYPDWGSHQTLMLSKLASRSNLSSVSPTRKR